MAKPCASQPRTPFPWAGVGADGPPPKEKWPHPSCPHYIPKGNSCPGCPLEGPVQVLSLLSPAPSWQSWSRPSCMPFAHPVTVTRVKIATLHNTSPSLRWTVGISWARTFIHLCSPIKCVSKIMCSAKMKPFRLRKQKKLRMIWSFPQFLFIPPASRNLLPQGSPFLMKFSPCIELNSISRSLPTLHSQKIISFHKITLNKLDILEYSPFHGQAPLLSIFVQYFQANHLPTFYALVFIDMICSEL